MLYRFGAGTRRSAATPLTQITCNRGFSDGASYALSVGITNGDLFTHVIAFSPGFVAPARQQETISVYLAWYTR